MSEEEIKKRLVQGQVPEELVLYILPVLKRHRLSWSDFLTHVIKQQVENHQKLIQVNKGKKDKK